MHALPSSQMVARARRSAQWGWERRLVKWLLRWLTGKGEVERVLDGEAWHSRRMSLAVARSLRHSRQLSHVRDLVSGARSATSFDVRCAAVMVADRKALCRRSDAIPRLVLCLHDLRRASRSLERLEQLRQRPLEPVRDRAAFEALWHALKPGHRRQSDADWVLIGFQGRDPTTDLRGMGSLASRSLAVLAEHHAPHLRGWASRFPTLPLAAVLVNFVALTLRAVQAREELGLDQDFYAPKSVSSAADQGANDADEVDRWPEEDETVETFAALLARLAGDFFDRHWHAAKHVIEFNSALAQFEQTLGV